ncbi:MAG: replication initiation protein [Prevotella sp.]|nr:replication initiation protein [Alistipes senegalensis]MCM1357096.1 replication initiation protein [Prevotella sp.]MCM1472582.1 replication initiation protein [Muribaculaceae bacterium]
MSLKNTYIVEKSNIFNEIRGNNMSLQELRFFSIYLAKINARDVSTRRVCFPLCDFQKIMEFGRLNIKQLQASTNKLLCKVVNVPNADGGYTGFTIFKRVRVFKDDSEKWCIEIDASDDALPLLFNLKKNYFTYELWNALRLKSVNQLRMYELLKQRERFSDFEIKVSELREYLYITPEQYPKMERFKARVLDSCQQALSENTDICFTYEKGKVGNRGKWLTIVFHISKNENYADPLALHEFIDTLPQPKSESVPDAPSQPPELPQGQSERQPYLSGEFEKDLEPDDIKALCDMLANKVSISERKPERLRTLLKSLYSEMILKSKEPVKKPVSYLLRMISNIAPEELEKLSSTSYAKKKSRQYGSRVHYDEDFDVDKYKIFINDFTVI